jgi:hypothetical protein
MSNEAAYFVERSVLTAARRMALRKRWQSDFAGGLSAR